MPLLLHSLSRHCQVGPITIPCSLLFLSRRSNPSPGCPSTLSQIPSALEPHFPSMASEGRLAEAPSSVVEPRIPSGLGSTAHRSKTAPTRLVSAPEVRLISAAVRRGWARAPPCPCSFLLPFSIGSLYLSHPPLFSFPIGAGSNPKATMSMPMEVHLSIHSPPPRALFDLALECVRHELQRLCPR